MKTETSATTFQLIGAGAFGAVLGWFFYFLNRYRKDVGLSDLGAVVGVIGAGAVLTLFPAKTSLFAAYAIGLAIGFFAYFLVLVAFVIVTKSSFRWFLGVPLDGTDPSEANRGMITNEQLNR